MRRKEEMKSGSKYLKNGLYLLEAVVVAFSLASVYGRADLPEELVINGIFRGIYNFLNGIRYSLNNQVMNVTAYFLGAFWCLKKYQDKVPRNFYVSSAVMGGIQAAVKAYKAAGRLTIMFETNTQMLVTCINIAGYAILFNMACKAVYWLMHHDFDMDFRLNNRFGVFYENHPFLSAWFAILLAWSVHIIIKYPGAMTSDNWGQLTQYNGMFPMYSHWPPFHTVLLGFFVYAGDSIHSTNWGLFSYVVMQWAVMSAIMAYTVDFMRRYRVGKAFRLVSLAIYAICPLYTGFVGVVEKDVLYAAFYVLFVIQLMEYVLNRESFCTLKNVFLLVVAGTMVGLFRKNGNYVMIPTLLSVCADYAVWMFGRKRLARHAYRLVYFICPIFLSLSINQAVIAHYDIRPGSVAEALSVPIQQTARYLRDYGEELSDSDRAVLSAVFEDVDALPARYNPRISDPAKGLFESEASMEEIAAYLKWWGGNFWRHPVTYLEATFAQNYYLFDLNIDNYSYYRDFHMAGDDRVEFFEIGWLQPWQDIAVVFYEMLHNLPVIGVLSDMAFYMTVFLLLLFMSIRERNKPVMFISIPFILSLLIIIAGPVVHTSTRYTLQIIYAMPSYAAFHKILRNCEEITC